MTDVYAGEPVSSAHNANHELRLTNAELDIAALEINYPLVKFEAVWTSDTSATTTETLVANSDVTFTAEATRYLVHVSCAGYGNTAGDNVAIRLRYAQAASVANTDTQLHELIFTIPGSNYLSSGAFIAITPVLTAAQYTFGLFVVRYNGSGTVHVGNPVGSTNRMIGTLLGG